MSPLLTADELGALGFSLVIFPGSITRAVTTAARDLLAELATPGTTAGRLDRMATFQDVNALVDLEGFDDWEQTISDRSKP